MKRIIIGIIVLGCVEAPALSYAGSCGKITEPMTVEAISQRIKPVGVVEIETVAGAPQAAEAKVELAANAGEERYKSTCSVCHATGVAGAPKFRNAEEWKSRVATGMDTMLKIAIQGKGAMPPKGTCMQCSDEELREAIKYMLPQ